ncbi:aromatic ring-hydroxylating dioxygenase subunit alpha [Virgibacillus pantothenticus]|uniref:aromatic ring-hydroxylating oxygenase subunit alpha n=1 Tax=Virgibacillus pantothenticus TaxID=1473 RepID=UPI001C22D712|nr:aromatic ring-hydroxylating dioxygenase subunit alpha [Virgibacillus pantothenticus]MBU8566432.1 aromatic ring-hydroxylating dioxygenase subunit alpha [Virgibacillus pantothenticus]MBU8600153.1 aromatic ring-hydroxylating dioxygenase subunit alpha [Virgibacillus pantothenticus]MBU8633915.1 aromatic ring-hydroxylating dioxygenase subunit alpha [Virgibacillus pantothenticus]MBU8641908.1 aromatic ring-hydroxylating dioxygenase subunit alpha [Virgibacillus pantothenticus]MBU8645692.1 aromatic r
MREIVRENKEKHEFLVHRSVFTDREILAIERAEIFNKCWLFIGHETEVPQRGDYKRKKVGGRNLLMVRSQDDQIRVLYNTCPHRGALVCRENEGNARVFRCFYHAWSFKNDGELVSMPGKDGFPEDFNSEGTKNMKAVKRLESYRGFLFVNFDGQAISLSNYLGNAKEYIDLIVDQSEFGLEALGGVQEYNVRANWKLLVENSADLYHGMPTHKTYFDIKQAQDKELKRVKLEGKGVALGNGHGVIEYVAPWGRPIAQWTPIWDENLKRDIEQIKTALVQKFGEERANRIANYNRNIIIFPNLIINDIMAITARTFYPTSPGYIEVTGYSLAPKGEKETHRIARNNNFLEFLGPGGFATPDDNEALELCQEAYTNNQDVEWNDISKGMIRGEENTLATDETQMRSFWRQYNTIMQGAIDKEAIHR